MTAVTVCVPVYNGAHWVGETLAHIAAQTLIDIRVLVSVDHGTDDSEGVCRAFERDPRFEVVVQAERRGWVGNVNALIAMVNTPFFCITPHDDLLEPRYLEATYARLQESPEASCAYSDLQGFGTDDPHIHQEDVRGSRVERCIDVMLNHYSAVAFRALVRRRDSADRPYLPRRIPNDFAADTAWMMELAVRGELRRVPETLYRKRYDDRSVHAGWSRWSRDEAIALATSMTECSARIALRELSDKTERDELLTATLLWLSGHTHSGGWGVPQTPREIATAVQAFTAATQDLWPLPDMPRVLAGTTQSLLRDALHRHSTDPLPAEPLLHRAIRAVRNLTARRP